MSKKPPTVDPDIMAELLEQPDVKREIKTMTPGTLEWYKGLLVSEGIYQRYVKERASKKGGKS